jgi:hypothetical protein
VLALLANKHSPGALVKVTAGGLVAVVMNVLQQQAIAGVLVSEGSCGLFEGGFMWAGLGEVLRLCVLTETSIR